MTSWISDMAISLISYLPTTGRLALGNSSLSWAQFAYYSAWARILFHFDQKITRPRALY